MRNFLEQFLRVAEASDPARSEQRWTAYREGADSPDPAFRAIAECSFATLVAWHGRGIYRHIWGFVRSDAADDIFQDVLRKLHERRKDPRLASFHENVLPWLRRVAICQCLDAHRESERRIVRESRASRPEAVEPPFARSEWNEAIARALGQLSPDCQQAVALHYFEGLTKQESAIALGIHRDTFAARLKSALDQMRRQIHFPALIAGGTAALPSALTAAPPAEAVGKLERLIPPIPPATSAAGKLKQAIAISLGGLAIGGTLAVGWVPAPGSPPGANRIPPTGEVMASETLQERNIRLVRSRVIPELLESAGERLPPDNPLRLVNVRAYGSAVECEFRTRLPLVPGWKPTGFRLRYCVFIRHMDLDADLKGRDDWKSVNPERPMILDLAIPGVPLPAIDLARDLVAGAKAAFDRLPDDARAEAERLRHVFGTGEELLLPPGLRGFSADGGKLYVVQPDRALSIRDDRGRWHAGGTCPGWWLIAQGDRLYCHSGSEILVRNAADPNAPWARWSECPAMKPDERSGFLTVADGRMVMAIQPCILYSKPLNAPAEPWKRHSVPGPFWPDGIVGAGRRLFAHDGRRLLVRAMADDSAAWTAAGTWRESNAFLAVDGDRLLAVGGEGPIQSRPIDAGPEFGWSVAGRVREPGRK